VVGKSIENSPSLSSVSLIGPERIIASLSSSILLEAEKVIVPEAARPFTLVYLPKTVLVVTSSDYLISAPSY
jgi:hypothetical protein